MIRRVKRLTPRGAAIPPATREMVKCKCCQLCRATYGQILHSDTDGIWVPRENIDHVIPVRWIKEHYFFVDANHPNNLLSVCHRENLAKKGAEDRLFVSDVLGFVQRMNQLGWSDHLRRAAEHFKIPEILRFF